MKQHAQESYGRAVFLQDKKVDDFAPSSNQ
jgi:hypothetical protein